MSHALNSVISFAVYKEWSFLYNYMTPTGDGNINFFAKTCAWIMFFFMVAATIIGGIEILVNIVQMLTCNFNYQNCCFCCHRRRRRASQRQNIVEAERRINNRQSAALKSLSTMFNRDAHDDHDECTICLVDFTDADFVTPLPCDRRHYFHSQCIESWF